MNSLEQTNPGFEAHNLLEFNFDFGPQRLGSGGWARISEEPFLRKPVVCRRVASATVATNRPLGGGILATTFKEGEEDPNRAMLITENVVSPEFFDTMRIPMLEGRGLTPFDRGRSRRASL